MYDIVISLFAPMALGWGFRKYGLAGDGAEKAFNQYLFYLAVPALTIVKVADTSFAGLGGTFAVMNFLPILASMLLVYAGWKAGLFGARLARLLVIVPALGNTVYLGFPVVSMSLGPENIGYAAVVSSLQNIFIFTVGFFFMGLMRGEDSADAGFGKLVLRNVILWSSLAGIALSYFGLKVPGLLHKLMSEIGMTTLPLSLFTIGLSLYGKTLRRDLAEVGWITALKMAYIPAVYLGLALLFGFKGTVSKVVFLQLAMPPAVLNYVIAREFGFDADLVSRSIVFTTLLLFPMLFLLDLAMDAFL